MKVAPGGTEEIEATVYEGVVTTVLPDVSRKVLPLRVCTSGLSFDSKCEATRVQAFLTSIAIKISLPFSCIMVCTIF